MMHKTLLLASALLSLFLSSACKRSFESLTNKDEVQQNDANRRRLESYVPDADREHNFDFEEVKSGIFDLNEIDAALREYQGHGVDEIFDLLSWAISDIKLETFPQDSSSLYVPKSFDNMSFFELFHEWDTLSFITSDSGSPSSRRSRLIQYVQEHFASDPAIILLCEAFTVNRVSQLFPLLSEANLFDIHHALGYILIQKPDTTYGQTALDILLACLSEVEYDPSTVEFILTTPLALSPDFVDEFFDALSGEIDPLLIERILGDRMNDGNFITCLPLLDIDEVHLTTALLSHKSELVVEAMARELTTINRETLDLAERLKYPESTLNVLLYCKRQTAREVNI